jgi:hypothetical protein
VSAEPALMLSGTEFRCVRSIAALQAPCSRSHHLYLHTYCASVSAQSDSLVRRSISLPPVVGVLHKACGVRALQQIRYGARLQRSLQTAIHPGCSVQASKSAPGEGCQESMSLCMGHSCRTHATEDGAGCQCLQNLARLERMVRAGAPGRPSDRGAVLQTVCNISTCSSAACGGSSHMKGL